MFSRSCRSLLRGPHSNHRPLHSRSRKRRGGGMGRRGRWCDTLSQLQEESKNRPWRNSKELGMQALRMGVHKAFAPNKDDLESGSFKRRSSASAEGAGSVWRGEGSTTSMPSSHTQTQIYHQAQHRVKRTLCRTRQPCQGFAKQCPALSPSGTWSLGGSREAGREGGGEGG